MRHLNLRAAAFALAFTFGATYSLCIIGDALFGWEMYRVWGGLFPGFAWNLQGIVVGFIESLLYGIYAALVIVVPYNFLHAWNEPQP